MWILALMMTAMGEVTVPPPTTPTTSEIHSEMDASMTRVLIPAPQPKDSVPVVIPCPKGMCQQINHTSQEAYNQTMLSNGWLSMANRYDTGSVLIPNPQSTDDRQFLHWKSDARSLWMMVESGIPTAYYATWTLEALNPTGNPFDPHRLRPLEETVDRWLETCNQTRPIAVDQRQNERAWSGTDCNDWDLWLEYNPTEERALSVIAIKR